MQLNIVTKIQLICSAFGVGAFSLVLYCDSPKNLQVLPLPKAKWMYQFWPSCLPTIPSRGRLRKSLHPKPLGERGGLPFKAFSSNSWIMCPHLNWLIIVVPTLLMGSADCVIAIRTHPYSKMWFITIHLTVASKIKGSFPKEIFTKKGCLDADWQNQQMFIARLSLNWIDDCFCFMF